VKSPLNGLTFLRNTLSRITHIASKSGNASTTTIVPIFAHHNNDKYANAKPKDIVPTSLISPRGRNSITAAMIVTPEKSHAHQIAALTMSNSSQFIPG
jgi:hypothetical protein